MTARSFSEKLRLMQKTHLRNAIAAILIFVSAEAHAQLPSMSKLPWIGYFMAAKSKKYQITITTAGSAKLDVLNNLGIVDHGFPSVGISFFIIETLPDGKNVRRALIPESLTSDQPATVDPTKPMSFRGQVEGNATFEAMYYPERGGFSFGGKVTDKGTLTNPISFAVVADFYPYAVIGKDKLEATEKLAKRDTIRFETTLRKRDEIEFLAEASSATAEPDQMTKAEISTEGFNRLSFKLLASSGTSFTLTSMNEKRFLEGFSLLWKTDPKTLNNAQRISFVVK